MASIFTDKQRVLNALATKQEVNLYLAIGRTSVWADELNPPTPLATDLTLTELIYIKKISVKHMVIDDDPYDVYGPDVQVGGYDYHFVADVDAFNENARSVYFSNTIYYSDIAPINTTFRQTGILLNPEGAGGVLLTAVEYLGANVIDQGEVLYINNHTYVTRDPSQSEKFEIILNF
jgi:hypothetical protein